MLFRILNTQKFCTTNDAILVLMRSNSIQMAQLIDEYLAICVRLFFSSSTKWVSPPADAPKLQLYHRRLLQGIFHAVKYVAINSNFKIFAGGKPPAPQMKLASLAPGPLPIKILATPLLLGLIFSRLCIMEDIIVRELKCVISKP